MCSTLEKSTLCVPTQYPLEGLSKVLVEDSVYDRVQAGVAVANPKKEYKQGVRNPANVGAHCLKRVREKEGEPADHKHSHHYSQDKGEPLFPVQHSLTTRYVSPLRLWCFSRYQFGAR